MPEPDITPSSSPKMSRSSRQKKKSILDFLRGRPGSRTRQKHSRAWHVQAVLSVVLVWWWAWLLFGALWTVLVYILFVFLLGIDPSKEDVTNFESSHYFLWVGILTFLTLFVVWKKTRKFHDNPFLGAGRTVLISYIWIGLVGCVIASIVFYVNGIREANHTKTATNVCSLDTTLNSALAATYPVRTDRGSGTAFAVDANGTLLTAYHVVEGAKNIRASLVTGEVPMTILRTAPEYDLALLKYGLPTPQYLPLANEYKLAEQVYGIGWPGNTFSAGQASVSAGIISRIIDNDAVRRSSGEAPVSLKFVQTDAAINPGNSGGALINACGAVGVIDAKSDSKELSARYGLPASEDGISYAVSAETAKIIFGL